MDRHNDLGARRDKRLDLRRIDVRLVRPAVRKDDLRPAADERECRRDERVGRDDHLISGTDPRQDRRHLQSVRTRRRQQALLESVALLEERLATMRELAIARNLPAFYGLTDVLRLLARHVGSVEMNHTCIISHLAQAFRQDRQPRIARPTRHERRILALVRPAPLVRSIQI